MSKQYKPGKTYPGKSTFQSGETLDNAIEERNAPVLKTFDEIFGGDIRPGETPRDAAERLLVGTKAKLEKVIISQSKSKREG